MRKYLIIIKIKTTKKEKIIKKQITKKLKNINNIKYKLKIIREEENFYKIKISLADLYFTINLENLIIKALESFELIKFKLVKIN